MSFLERFENRLTLRDRILKALSDADNHTLGASDLKEIVQAPTWAEFNEMLEDLAGAYVLAINEGETDTGVMLTPEGESLAREVSVDSTRRVAAGH